MGTITVADFFDYYGDIFTDAEQDGAAVDVALIFDDDGGAAWRARDIEKEQDFTDALQNGGAAFMDCIVEDYALAGYKMRLYIRG